MAANLPSPLRFTFHALRRLLLSIFHFPLFSFFLLALLFLWPITLRPTAVPFNPHAAFTDLLVSHLPNAQYVLTSLLRHGQLPLWNAQIMAGQPFLADPLAGVWYPPLWLAILYPQPVMFNLLLAAHLAWAGYGLFGLLRDEGLGQPASLVGGLALTGLPKLIAHFAAGHVSLILAIAWTPWLLRAIRCATAQGGVKRGALVGACLALLLAADVRWAFYAGCLGAAWWVRHLPPFASRQPKQLSAAAAFTIFFLALSAGLALPLSEFLLHSGRGVLTLAEAGEFSLPPLYLLGLLIPDPYGQHETLTYLGLPTLLLALLGLGRKTRFWMLAVVVALAFALGTNFILFPLLFRLLPGLAFLRVPGRAWFIVGLGAAMLAGYGVERLLTALNAKVTEHHVQRPRVQRPRVQRPRVQRALPWVIAVFVAADLARVSGALVEARPMPARLPATAWLAAQLGLEQTRLFRVYSPVYSLPQPDPLQHADGVDPLYLADYARFLSQASGIPANGYSVVVPPLIEDGPDTKSAAPNAEALGLLNVKYVAVPFPLLTPGFQLLKNFDGTLIYENTAARPRAWLEPADGAAEGAAEITTWSPNRITVHATGPGRLVLSEIIYPGWQARVDGALVPIETAAEVLRGVTLTAGPHVVVFEFQPPWVYIGAVITLVGLVALLGIVLWVK